jgi:hypothetical protein
MDAARRLGESQVNATAGTSANRAAYIAPIAPMGDGKRALTHLAHVRVNDLTHRAYVKAYPNHLPRGLTNEVVGHALAKIHGLPQPDSYLVDVPRDALLSLYPEVTIPDSAVTCFCSVEEADRFGRTVGSAKMFFGDANVAGLAEKLVGWSGCAALVAFDQWLANNDRNTGNLLYEGRGKFMIIDHGEILTGANWKQADLKCEAYVVNKVLDLVLDPTGCVSGVLASAIVLAAERLQSVYADAIPVLSERLNGSCGSDEHRAHFYIWKRSEITVDLIKTRLGALL